PPEGFGASWLPPGNCGAVSAPAPLQPPRRRVRSAVPSMQFLMRLGPWSLLIAIAALSSGAWKMETDPVDDFSFSLAHAPEVDAHRLISVRRVTEVLEDRLTG